MLSELVVTDSKSNITWKYSNKVHQNCTWVQCMSNCIYLLSTSVYQLLFSFRHMNVTLTCKVLCSWRLRWWTATTGTSLRSGPSPPRMHPPWGLPLEERWRRTEMSKTILHTMWKLMVNTSPQRTEMSRKHQREQLMLERELEHLIMCATSALDNVRRVRCHSRRKVKQPATGGLSFGEWSQLRCDSDSSESPSISSGNENTTKHRQCNIRPL